MLTRCFWMISVSQRFRGAIRLEERLLNAIAENIKSIITPDNYNRWYSADHKIASTYYGAYYDNYYILLRLCNVDGRTARARGIEWLARFIRKRLSSRRDTWDENRRRSREIVWIDFHWHFPGGVTTHPHRVHSRMHAWTHARGDQRGITTRPFSSPIYPSR